MKKEIGQIKDEKRRKLYNALWGENEFVEKLGIRRAPYKSGVSDNSYIFDIKGDSKEEKRDGIKKIFKIDETDLFDKKFNEACQGSGQEGTRITTLHSSSLCALLVFYGISAENPLILEIDGKRIIFTDTIFEFQNMVIEGRNPSNIDVVLKGETDGRRVILFLESKFSEYYQSVGKSLDVSNAYLDDHIVSRSIYNVPEFCSKLGLSLGKARETDDFRIESKETMYIEGIKQMISHCVGIYNFVSGKSRIEQDERQSDLKDFYDDTTLVLLGEILFDYRIGDLTIGNACESCFESYAKKYKVLAEIINSRKEIKPLFRMVPEVITYSEIFDNNGFKINSQIRDFYSHSSHI